MNESSSLPIATHAGASEPLTKKTSAEKTSKEEEPPIQETATANKATNKTPSIEPNSTTNKTTNEEPQSKQNASSDVISISDTTNEEEDENIIANHQIYKLFSPEKKEASITDFFSVKKGRKRKFANKRLRRTEKKSKNETNTSETESNKHNFYGGVTVQTNTIMLSSSLSSLSKNSNKPTKGRMRIVWSSPEYFPLMVETIQSKRALGKLFQNPPMGPNGIFVPPTTLFNVMKRLGDRPPTLKNCFPQKKNSLLSTDDIIVLQDIIRKRDCSNAGVSRKEAVQIIVDLGQAKSYKSAENHLDYLIRPEKLVHLKRKGRIVSAQATTSERCQINVEQQMRWHFLIKSEWRYLRSINLPEVDFAKLHKHFQLNLDEACFLCSDGILKIIGDAYRRHHDKNVADNRVSITTIRIGTAVVMLNSSSVEY